MTSKEYQELIKSKKVPEPVLEFGKLTTKDALKAMGAYFDLDSKKVSFWIRQMELNGKI
jgi:hypothetical protein